MFFVFTKMKRKRKSGSDSDGKMSEDGKEATGELVDKEQSDDAPVDGALPILSDEDSDVVDREPS